MDAGDSLVVSLAAPHEATHGPIEATHQEQKQKQEQDKHKHQHEVEINLQEQREKNEEQQQQQQEQQQDEQHWEDAAIDAEVEAVIMGQTESKKHSGNKGANRLNGNGNGNGNENVGGGGVNDVHTKGTAMSFGFRKKLNSTPKKLKKLLETPHTKTDTIQDDNGNATPPTSAPVEMSIPEPVHFEKVGTAAPRSSGHNSPGAAGKRFGYRGAMPRPASTGLSTTTNEEANLQNNNCTIQNGSHNNNNNNNNNSGSNQGNSGNVLVSNLKRRSKSAHAGRAGNSGSDAGYDGETKITQPKTLTFNLNQNTTIEYQRRQFFGELADDEACPGPRSGARSQRCNYSNLASMHANVVVRPTAASYAKFTLQTVSLPRPEYPVAISLSANTPTTPGSSVQSPVPAHQTGARAKETSSTTTTASTKQQHPLTSIHARQLDPKSVKQMANNSTRRGFSGSREISADSGIASMDMAMDSSGSSSSSIRRANVSPKRSRSRPRNLQMVMSGRHTFEVRDMVDDPPSSESSSFVETLALPKLPADGDQSRPLPLLGLVRSNTVLSRESYERRQSSTSASSVPLQRNGSGSEENSESVDEEKLYLDSSTSEKSAKKEVEKEQQQQEPGNSSVSSSWCQAGESLAAKDCCSMSMSISMSSSEAARQPASTGVQERHIEKDGSLDLDDISLVNTDMQFSTMSSLTENVPLARAQMPEPLLKMHIVDNREKERPRSFSNALNESKFAELALASSDCLLEDETSPTDSLVSSTESSEEAGDKLKKHKLNAQLQEKDIDEISPEIELASPISPGTPTHASHSLSLGSDCGNLIDDEIADQPALLFNSEAQELSVGEMSLAHNTDTPTLMDTQLNSSMRSLKSQSKARTALQQAIELSLRTPAALRKAVMKHAESLDTLSPCESICSDDLMMDFDMNSSIDSIDRPTSVRSRSGSDIHKIDQLDQLDQVEHAELLSELERKDSDIMKELNSLLRVRAQRSAPRERISAHLPARATRLLNRSRLQDQQQCNSSANADSDNSLRSTHSGAARKRSAAASRASTASSSSSLHRRQQQQHQQHQQKQKQQSSQQQSELQHQQRHIELHSSSDDLMLYDKSFRNAMIQDVLLFKKQLLRLRRILQETETLNPFEHDNGQLFAACGLDSKQLNDIDLASLTTSTSEDPLQELSDLRRQVVYLQGQVDDRDRTIRLQKDLIDQLEAERRQANNNATSNSDATNTTAVTAKERIHMATQTERTRPLAIGAEGLSRSKPEYTSYTTHFPTLQCNDSMMASTTSNTTIIQHHHQKQPICRRQCNPQALNQTRRHTIISTTLTNYNQQLAAAATPSSAYPRRASIDWHPPGCSQLQQQPTPPPPPITTNPAVYKPVRITLIGEPMPPAKLYQPLYNSNNMTNPTVTIV